MNKKIIDVYVMRDALKAAVSFVQGTDAVPLVFMFRDYTIPDGAKASVMVKKPSGKEVQDFAVINFLENSVEVDVSAQMVAEAGTSEMMLELKPGKRTVFTFSQPITVEKNSTQVESDTGSTIIDKYLNDMVEATNDARNATEEIETKAKNGDFSTSIEIESVETGDSGTEAVVRNTGNKKDMKLAFVIPRGNTGPQGAQGARGPQGLKGDKGDKGETGASGVVVPTNGMFTLAGDEDGNLYAYYADGTAPPSFETDADGNIYYLTPEE